MRNLTSLLDDLHDLRSIALKRGMERTAERLRIAIIEAAVELELPTGLSAKDLSKGLDFDPSCSDASGVQRFWPKI